MFPTREEALKLIRDGLLFNPGPWGKHCLTAAHCAEKIASACGDMDVEKAYILGLLHDIGRKFGVRHLGHVYDGYVYISSFWGSETESILLSIFVLPEFHGKGVGRKIINILETDEFYVRASRIEIPASITATEFYRKFGYDYKNGVKELDNEHHYRLEKFKEAGLK